MYAPTPSSIQVHEHRRQEMLAHAAAVRFVADARRSGNAAAADICKPRPTFARSLVASLASIFFAITARQPGVSASRDA